MDTNMSITFNNITFEDAEILTKYAHGLLVSGAVGPSATVGQTGTGAPDPTPATIAPGGDIVPDAAAAPPATDAPDTSALAVIERDAHGIRYDERIHTNKTAAKLYKNDGTWSGKRGVKNKDGTFITPELQGVYSALVDEAQVVGVYTGPSIPGATAAAPAATAAIPDPAAPAAAQPVDADGNMEIPAGLVRTAAVPDSPAPAATPAPAVAIPATYDGLSAFVTEKMVAGELSSGDYTEFLTAFAAKDSDGNPSLPAFANADAVTIQLAIDHVQKLLV